MSKKDNFDAFVSARLPSEDEHRIFHSFAAKWQGADQTLDIKHQDRTLCMYHFAATRWLQIFSIAMASKFPQVLIARPKGSPLARLDTSWKGVVLQTEKNTKTELVMGRGDLYRTMFEKTIVQLGVARTDHEAAFMAKDEQFLVHMFSYADNSEDFAHRAFTPLMNHGIES